MPTEVHECHLNWFRDETLDWISNGLMTLQELKWLKMYSSPSVFQPNLIRHLVVLLFDIADLL